MQLPLVINFFCEAHEVFDFQHGAVVQNGPAGEFAEDLMLIGAICVITGVYLIISGLGIPVLPWLSRGHRRSVEKKKSLK